jgi:hypothetical protein
MSLTHSFQRFITMIFDSVNQLDQQRTVLESPPWRRRRFR